MQKQAQGTGQSLPDLDERSPHMPLSSVHGTFIEAAILRMSVNDMHGLGPAASYPASS